MDTLIFIILHRCYRPGENRLASTSGPRGSDVLIKGVFTPSTSNFQEFTHSSSHFAILKCFLDWILHLSWSFIHLKCAQKLLTPLVTLSFAVICPWNLIQSFPYYRWECRSAQFRLMSINKSVILREEPLSVPLLPLFNLALLINTGVNM